MFQSNQNTYIGSHLHAQKTGCIMSGAVHLDYSYVIFHEEVYMSSQKVNGSIHSTISLQQSVVM